MEDPDKPLTVGELVAELQKLDPSLPVWFDCSDEYYSGPFVRADIMVGTHEVSFYRAYDVKQAPSWNDPKGERIVTFGPGMDLKERGEPSYRDTAEIDRQPCVVFRVE